MQNIFGNFLRYLKWAAGVKEYKIDLQLFKLTFQVFFLQISYILHLYTRTCVHYNVKYYSDVGIRGKIDTEQFLRNSCGLIHRTPLFPRSTFFPLCPLPSSPQLLKRRSSELLFFFKKRRMCPRLKLTLIV
jgi:hypothetical protein